MSADRTVSTGLSLDKIEMRDLAQRMDAGVGAAGALHGRALAAEGEYGVFERGLDRRAVGLALPADERARRHIRSVSL